MTSTSSTTCPSSTLSPAILSALFPPPLYRLSDALQQALDGRRLNIGIDEVIRCIRDSGAADSRSPTFQKVVKGEGMPSVANPSVRGDLFVTFNIAFPKAVSDDQKLFINVGLAFPQLRAEQLQLVRSALKLPPKLSAEDAEALKRVNDAALKAGL